MRKIIQSYIDKLTKNDIASFAFKHDIHLSQEEISILYFYVKNEYETLLYKDSTALFLELKGKISKCNYEKITALFYNYKEKYKHYL